MSRLTPPRRLQFPVSIGRLREWCNDDKTREEERKDAGPHGQTSNAEHLRHHQDFGHPLPDYADGPKHQPMSVSEICYDARRRAHVPEIVILSERDALAYEPTGREVCISVTDPDKTAPPLSPGFLSILHLAFSDLVEPSGVDSDVIFNDRHGRAVVTFAHQWKDAERLVIHCRAGLSRSPGIAIGLCELFSWGPTAGIEEQHPLWNRRVRREVVLAGREVFAHAK